MEAFGELLENLTYATATTAKLRLLEDYFGKTPDPDRGWALSVLTEGLPFSLPLRKSLQKIMASHIDPVLYDLARDYVGDTAETVALLWPDQASGTPPTITEAVLAAQHADGSFPELLASLLDRLSTRARIALIKLYGGALRVGVSARLSKTALARWSGKDVNEVEEAWSNDHPPFLLIFNWLSGGPELQSQSVLSPRPLMLAHALEEKDLEKFATEDIIAEWKWDGIRVQIVGTGDQARLYARSGDEITSSFPEIAVNFKNAIGIFDGELLVVKQGIVAPFSDLQQRLNRKAPNAKLMAQYPAHVRLYDMLFEGLLDIRDRPFLERRSRLKKWLDDFAPVAADLSDIVPFTSFDELRKIWADTREGGIEGLVLKRADSPYLSGRRKGYWFKWKRAPLTVDCVLLYAQRGSGKRSSLYSDLTFAAWDGDRLVPVGKSYSGFTDEELAKLDKWIRQHTVEQFGPVRSVKPELVLEIAFDGLNESKRHKSGVAMRFPRIARIRWDKPAAEADHLESLRQLLHQA